MIDLEHINDHFDNLQTDTAYIRGRLDAIVAGLDKINGRVTRNEQDITSLKIRIAYWSGGAAVVATLVGWLLQAHK